MSPQIKMNEEEKAVGIGCCRICLISKVNCDNCRFAFALPAIEAERLEKVPEFIGAIIKEMYADDPFMRMRLGLDDLD